MRTSRDHLRPERDQLHARVRWESITFHPCGVTSFNRNDIEQRYCVVCHRFMDLVDLAKELSREIEGNGDLHDQ